MFENPKWLVFQLNELCDLRCTMCYQWGESGVYIDKPIKELKKLDENIILDILDQCEKFSPYIGLFGGEPLLYKKIWQIIAKAKSIGSEIYLDTNGTTLSFNAQKLVESNLDRMWISLDGPEEMNDKQRGKGVYSKVVKGIEDLSAMKKKAGVEKPEIGITYIVTPINQDGIAKLFTKDLDLSLINNISIEFQNFVLKDQWQQYDSLLKEKSWNIEGGTYAKAIIREENEFASLDFDNISNQIDSVMKFCNEKGVNIMVSPKDFSSHNIETYFTAQWDKLSNKKDFCALPWKYAEIASDGNVTMCHTFYDNIIGNVNEQRFSDIWNGNKANEIRKYLKKNLYSICPGCSRYHTDVSTRK